MPKKYWIVPVPGGPVDPGYGVPGAGPVDPGYGIEGPETEPPTVGGGPLPPLPGIWPPPGRPTHLPAPSPPTAENPIVLPEEPGHPLPLPPGTIWPPLPPDFDHGGKKAILIWVVGVGKRWFIYDPSQLPPRPEPKGR